MECKLIHSSPLWLASNGCRMSHDSHDKSDTEDMLICGGKDRELIKRIGVKLKHESILEFLTYIWDVELSTKTLLAFSRHRVGISLTMRSTRYTTKKNKGKHKCQTEYLSEYTDRIMSIVDEAINNGLSNDDISLLLPQDYVYRGQIQMNGRSLKHFLELRNPNSHAHWQIKDFAKSLFDTLPSEHSYLFEDYMNGTDKES
jgi:thymidylate synthase (FAD)